MTQIVDREVLSITWIPSEKIEVPNNRENIN